MTTQPDQCEYCEYPEHAYITQCPNVKAVEYHEDGTLKRVEKLVPTDRYHPPQPQPIAPPMGPGLPWPQLPAQPWTYTVRPPGDNS